MYFTLSQMQYFMISIFGGLLLVLILFLVYWSYRLGTARSRADAEPEETEEAGKEEFADGLEESHKPVPLVLTILIAAVLIWGIIYVLAIAMGGLNVQ